MFISVLELFKLGIGPSSSHTVGPMVAAGEFLKRLQIDSDRLSIQKYESQDLTVRCILKGSLSLTGHGHATDKAVILGLNGHIPDKIAHLDIGQEILRLENNKTISLKNGKTLNFYPPEDIVFDMEEALPEHPNGMILDVLDAEGNVLVSETYFSIGGGFINTKDEMQGLVAPLKMAKAATHPYPFDTADAMLQMAKENNMTIAQMKRANELQELSEDELNRGLDDIWFAMRSCVENGLKNDGTLPGGLNVERRAKELYHQLQNGTDIPLNDWLCAYAMAVNEENAAGHAVVTAPTNGAAGVIPAVLYYWYRHQNATTEQIHDFLLTAGAIGGLIKHRSSISGAEVGCQGEVGSASSMAAAGLCAVREGTPEQVENAAEIALEHHLGMTCDPVKGLVQVPCIERNGFGALKAYTAASLALRGSGHHIMSLDNCVSAMKQTGLEMSVKYKETSLGGLAVNYTEC